MDANNLSTIEIDAIGEILNISLGASATAVSTMLDARVDITTPIVSVKTRDQFEFTSMEPAVGVEITYIEGLDGSNIMLLKRSDVKVIVEMLMGMEIPEEEFELDEMNISAICEVMNQMMGASATALSELLSKAVNISTPCSFEIESANQFKEKYFADNNKMVVIRFNLSIGDKLCSEFMNLMPIGLAKELVSGFFPDGVPEELSEEPAESQESAPAPMTQEEIERMLQSMTEAAAPVQSEPQMQAAAPVQSEPQMQAAAPVQSEPQMQAAAPVQSEPQMQAAAPVQSEPQMQAAAPVQSMPQMQAAAPAMDAAMMNNMMQMMEMMRQSLELQQQQMHEVPPKKIKVHAMPQPNLNASEHTEDAAEDNLEMMMDVPMELSVEIGRTRKMVKDILDLNKGSLVVLDKLAGEQVDLFINGQCIAKGDVVVVDDNFGIRITEIL